MKPKRLLILATVLCVFAQDMGAQLPGGSLFRRVSRVSNFEFAIHNNGMLFGNWSNELPQGWLFAEPLAHWPRGSFHLRSDGLWQGFLFLAKKQGRLLSSESNFMREVSSINGPFNQMVPGRIGDPRGGYDPLFDGDGWLYVDDADYIIYSSMDYDSDGVDISGSNFNDWPVRLLNGERTYVPNPQDRRSYPPVYVSDEDMFCVFKDTDTRADPIFTGPQGPSVPIGIEVQNSVFTWGTGPGKDIVVLQYDVINKSGVALDSCFVVFGSGLRLAGPNYRYSPNQNVRRFSEEPYRNLVLVQDTVPAAWPEWWFATPAPPTLGYTFLETHRSDGLTGNGLHYGGYMDTAMFYPDPFGIIQRVDFSSSDSIVYRNLTTPYRCTSPPYYSCEHATDYAMLITLPFGMAASETIRTTFAYLFSDSLPHLLLMHDFITRVYQNNFQRPSPPPTPKLTATGLNRSIKLSWDTSAESAKDIIIPDSLGRPFVGYSLQRASNQEGPYKEIGRWHTDTLLVHEYLDRGDSSSGGPPGGEAGLKNNVTYYYRLLSFDEGAVKLKLDPMESPPVEGVNEVAVIPSTEPSDEGGKEVTQEMLEAIRVVPNPYLITHEAQRGDPRVFFNYLPTDCIIRIYTIGLDLVKTIVHSQGSREEWDLKTEGGQLVASQMFLAYIEAGNGLKTTKQFAVVVGR